MRYRAGLACLLVALPLCAAPAERAPDPWGVERFVAEQAMWGGCKPGSKARFRVETTLFVGTEFKKRVREEERRLAGIEGVNCTLAIRNRDLDAKGKPGRWESREYTGRLGVDKIETKEVGKTTYRMGRTRLPVNKIRVWVTKELYEEEFDFLVHEEYGVLHAKLYSKDVTKEWRLVTLAVKCKVGRKSIECREYEYKNHLKESGLKVDRRLLLNPTVPGYVVRSEYSLLSLSDTIEHLVSYKRK